MGKSKGPENTQGSKTCEVVLPEEKSAEQVSAIIAVTTKLAPTPATQTPAVLSKENPKRSAEKVEATKPSMEKMMSQEKFDERKPPTSLPVARTMPSERSSTGSKQGVVAARSNEKLLPSKHKSAEKLRMPPKKSIEPLSDVAKKSAIRTAPSRLSNERVTKASAEQMIREKAPLLLRKST
ncbi:hypothetical protein Aduo_002394 [Ancylostoma duodenale]